MAPSNLKIRQTFYETTQKSSTMLILLIPKEARMLSGFLLKNSKMEPSKYAKPKNLPMLKCMFLPTTMNTAKRGTAKK
jgi:hypothetical protein